MSCLFISLGKLLGQPHTTVRNTICNYMQHHLDHPFQGMPIRDWIRWQQQAPSPEAYIRSMRSTSEWGGAMELSMATQCFVTDILVVDGRGRTVAEFVWREHCTARRKMVLWWTGNHYEPVRWVMLDGGGRMGIEEGFALSEPTVAPPPPTSPAPTAARVATIFVSIPSYRDTDCSKTLRSLFANADLPDRIFVGLYEQNHPDQPDENCVIDDNHPLAVYGTQIRRVRVPHTKAKGPLWARTQITRLYRGETYMLMIDAHSVFLRHWDTRMKNELDYLRDHYRIDKPVLSCYPHHSDTLQADEPVASTAVQPGQPATGKPANEKRHLTAHICNVTKANRLPLVLGAEEKPSGKYYRTLFIGAGFVFTYGTFCDTLGTALQSLHLPHVFSGEEILFAAIAYTHGWNIYSPPYVNVFHLYEHTKPSWFTDNVAPRKKASDAQRASEARLRTLLDTDHNTGCLGTARTLGDFWNEMGFYRDRAQTEETAASAPSQTDEESVREVYPKESKDKWCARAESWVYPVVEAFCSDRIRE